MKPEEVNPLLQEAFGHFKNARYSQAEGMCESILQSYNDNVDALNLMASTMLNKGDTQRAVEFQEKAIAINEQSTELLKNMELIYRKNNQYEDALDIIRKVISKSSANAVYRYCEGLSLCHLWRIEEAVEAFRLSSEIDPTYVKAHVMLGNTLQELGEYEDALMHFNKADDLNPNDPHVIYNRSILLMLMGDFAEGLKDYEARWQQGPPLVLPKCVESKPVWKGEDFGDKRLFIMMEQGHGDTLQFCRYIPQIVQSGKNITILCADNLVKLLKPLAPNAEWISHNDKAPEFDLYVTMMSLPLIMKTEVETIPCDVPYLFSVEKYQKKWKHYICDNERPRIGLCWSGSSKHPKDHIRSISPKQIEVLFGNDDFDFYILEKGRGEDQAKDFACKYDNVTELGSMIENFSDSAAIINKMDLIITVDTAIAHLAGAMGKKTWSLLLFNADWRWLLEREDSPWYLTMRLFRQSTRGDWESVLKRVMEELKKEDE